MEHICLSASIMTNEQSNERTDRQSVPISRSFLEDCICDLYIVGLHCLGGCGKCSIFCTRKHNSTELVIAVSTNLAFVSL